MSQWDDLIQQAGQRYNVDPKLIASLIQVESSGNPSAYNASTGATGLGQQIPATAKSLGIDPKDPAQSIDGVAKLLNENLNRYGSPEQAILAYHGGTDQSNWGPKTQDYLRKVSTQYGAPQVAQPSANDFASQDFAAAPTAPASTAGDFAAQDFGSAPTSSPAAAAPVPQAQQPVEQEPERISAAVTQPDKGGIANAAWDGLQELGKVGLSNANAVGRGIIDTFDAPSEWLASGAEKIGLTGLLAKAGINMPTAEQQQQMNAQSRADYDARNPDAGVQGFLGRMAGNAAGVMVPIAGAEAGLAQAGGKLSAALGNPQALNAAGRFLGGQGGVVSRSANSALQGATGGALLSGGQPDASTGDQALLGAALGAVIPGGVAAARYVGNTARSVAAPFSASGRAGIAERAIQAEAAKDPGNMAQNILVPQGQRSSSGIPSTPSAPTAINARFNSAQPTAGPSPATAAGASADDALSRAGAGGRINANFDEIVPGSLPTLAQATGNAGIAALERAAMSRSPNSFAERQLSNYTARNSYLDTIKGNPETLTAAIAQREEQAIPLLKDALANARPANANPVMNEIDSILKSPDGQRDAVVSALNKVKAKLAVPDGGVETDVAQLYGIRKSINDQLEKVAGKDNSEAQQASAQLLQVKSALDDTIEKAAPNFKDYLKQYADLSKPIDAQRYLQGLDLTDQTSQKITLSKVKSAINRIDKLRAAPSANEAKSISDDQLGMLRNLQADLQREAHSSRGMAIGSNTFQNFATNQLIDSMLPGKLGAIAPVTPSTLGGALGYALGGSMGAGIGAVGAQQAAGVAGRAMNAQGPEIEARLIDYLLNPRGADILRQGSANSGALDLLLRRGSVAPSSAINAGSSSPSLGNNR